MCKVYQILCQAHLEDVGLTQNQETVITSKFRNTHITY